MINDKYIISRFISHDKLNNNYRKWFTSEVSKYLLNRFPDTTCEVESIVRIFLKIETRPICKICGNPVKFHNSVKKPFNDTCCVSCANKLRASHVNIEKRNEAIKKSIKEKYGVDNVFQLEDIKEKIKEVKLKKYGDEYWIDREKVKETLFKHYGGPSYFSNKELKRKSIEKKHNTVKERYGVDNVFQAECVKEKCKKTLLNNYGVDNYAKTPDWAIKYKNTSIKKYNVDNPMKFDEFISKSIQTKLKNKTISSSKPEELTYKTLLSVFSENDVFRQYKSKEYPFHCDFYIKSLNLYIECQYGWLHHKFPYNENDEICINKIQEWNEKSLNHPMYKSAINTWSISDVKKRNIAKQNNLNYLEFFTFDDFKIWIEKIKAET